jgi:L-ribulose-5-phosphate 4-epimerase
VRHLLAEEDKMLEAFDLMARNKGSFNDAHGNLSYFVDETCDMLIKPSGVQYEEIVLPQQICCIVSDEIDPVSFHCAKDDRRLSQLKPSVDTIHHLEIYHRNTGIKSICHTHSPNVTAHAMANMSMLCYCTEQADMFGGDVNCLPYMDLSEWGVLVGDELAETLGIDNRNSKNAILLGNHGALTFADDPVSAVKLAISLENLATKNMLMQTLLMGNKQDRLLSKKEIDSWRKRYVTSYGQENEQ